MPFRPTEPTLRNAAPIRTPDGTLIGAIARARGGIPGTWEPYVINRTGDSYDKVTNGGIPITEADAEVRNHHQHLAIQGVR